jgi:predicted DNA-binding transcriptional regulator AlpA
MEAPTNGNLLVVTSEEELQRLLDEAVAATLPEHFASSGPPDGTSRPPKEVLSNREAMEFLDLSKSTLQRYRDDGTLPYSKLGGNVYYEREDLLRVVREHRVSSPANS